LYHQELLCFFRSFFSVIANPRYYCHNQKNSKKADYFNSSLIFNYSSSGDVIAHYVHPDNISV
ncbi:hypothetical protein, partial [Klebsiella pneumoniae]|uniref:hypothetical protein n=1 Tax=Klebsiella pneumoniae TaxID=573 RepID=UPI000E350C70